MNAVREVPTPDWHRATSLSALREKNALLVRIAGRQIALFDQQRAAQSAG